MIGNLPRLTTTITLVAAGDTFLTGTDTAWDRVSAQDRDRLAAQLGQTIAVALPSGPPVLLHTEVMREHLLVSEGPAGAWPRYSDLRWWMLRLPEASRSTLDALADLWFATS